MMKLPTLLRRFVFSGGIGCCLLTVMATGTVRAGVIAHWSFDKAEADGTYPDSVNNEHPATPVDKSEVLVYSGAEPAPFGQAVTFLGPTHPNSYLTIPPLTNVQRTSLTVAAWVNLAAPESAFVLTDWPTMTDSSFAFGFHPFGSDKTTAQLIANLTSVELVGGRGYDRTYRRSIVRQALPDKSVPLNGWHHIAWAWDRDVGTLTSYLDGEFLAETRRTPGDTLDVAESDRRVRIGSQELSVAGNTPAVMTGSLDELWIFDEPLTPIQLRNLVKANNIRGAEAPPVAVTKPVVPEITSPVNPDPALSGTTVVAPPPDTGVGVSPPVPSRSSERELGAISNRRASPGRVAAILMCLTVIVTATCYLIWAFAERAKLRAAGHYR